MSYSVRNIKYPDDKPFLTGILTKYLKFKNGSTPSIEWNYETDLLRPATGKVLVFKDNNDAAYDVGSLNVLKRKFILNQKRYDVSLFGDFVVEASHRTLSPAIKLSKEAAHSALDDSIFVYGFPNAKALPVLRMSGFKSIGQVTRYAFIVSYSKYLSRLSRFPVLPFAIGLFIDLVKGTSAHLFNTITLNNYKIDEVDYFDSDIENVVKHSDYNTLICNTRSSKYLNWRYFNNPQHNFTALISRSDKDNEPDGFIVLEMDRDTIHIRDVFAINSSILVRLLKSAKELALIKDIAVISFSFFGSQSIVTLLKRSGFSSRESVRHFVINARNDDSWKCLYDRNNWFIVDGDEDQ